MDDAFTPEERSGLEARLRSLEEELSRLTLDRLRLPGGIADAVFRDQAEELEAARDVIRNKLELPRCQRDRLPMPWRLRQPSEERRSDPVAQSERSQLGDPPMSSLA